MTPERRRDLESLQARLGHEFADLASLDRALTHASRANEDQSGTTRHNEALEFLGDAVLGFLVSDLLHCRDPDGDEGTKSKTRAGLVRTEALSRRAEALGLPELLSLGRGEEKTGGRKKASLWADAYEAVVAALYLDGGFEAVRLFVQQDLADDLLPGRLVSGDFKSALQERLQARGEPPPAYEVVAETGPSHRRRFRVRCVVAGESISEGEGYSKKEAQQAAAEAALQELA